MTSEELKNEIVKMEFEFDQDDPAMIQFYRMMSDEQLREFFIMLKERARDTTRSNQERTAYKLAMYAFKTIRLKELKHSLLEFEA